MIRKKVTARNISMCGKVSHLFVCQKGFFRHPRRRPGRLVGVDLSALVSETHQSAAQYRKSTSFLKSLIESFPLVEFVGGNSICERFHLAP